MQYTATSQGQFILSMAFLSLFISIKNWDTTALKWLFLIIFIIAFLITLFKYTLVINNHTIVYTIQLFGLTIYRKKVEPLDIKKIIFKRINWKSKLAVIKIQKGFSIRVTLFTPENVFNDLIKFCEDNAIHYEKTKDYKIIEKME